MLELLDCELLLMLDDSLEVAELELELSELLPELTELELDNDVDEDELLDDVPLALDDEGDVLVLDAELKLDDDETEDGELRLLTEEVDDNELEAELKLLTLLVDELDEPNDEVLDIELEAELKLLVDEPELSDELALLVDEVDDVELTLLVELIELLGLEVELEDSDDAELVELWLDVDEPELVDDADKLLVELSLL